jgi:hypothetical protein
MASSRRMLGQQLVEAALEGELPKVEALLRQGADIEHKHNREGVSYVCLSSDVYMGSGY